MIELEWWYLPDQDEVHVTGTRAEVDAVLDELAGLAREDWPALAEVTRASDDLRGPLLYVGLRGARGALLYSS